MEKRSTHDDAVRAPLLKDPPSDGSFVSNEVSVFREARRYRLVSLVMGVGVFILLGFGFGDLFQGRPLEASFNFLIGAALAISLRVLRKREIQTGLFSCLRVIIFLLGSLFLYYISASYEHEYKVLWSYPYPLIVFFLFGKREGTAWMLVFYLFAAGLCLAPFAVSDLPAHNVSFNLRFLISLAIVWVLSHIFINAHEETLAQLEEQCQRRLDSERRYREAYETLKETQYQLIQSDKLAAIGELASGVAHELNQPLMVIRAHAQLVLRGLDKQAFSPEEMRERIQPIEQGTKRMMNIINHLRTFSRQSREAFSPVDINRVVKECFLMVKEQLRVHNVDLKYELADPLPKVMGNANQLEQVFLNIITNARDAVLGAGTEERTAGLIVVTTGTWGKDPEWVEVRVKDTGKGIADEALDRIFEAFFTTKEAGKGTGLGLSISQGIVKEHCGEIEVAETGPDGTTMRIRLPGENLKQNKNKTS